MSQLLHRVLYGEHGRWRVHNHLGDISDHLRYVDRRQLPYAAQGVLRVEHQSDSICDALKGQVMHSILKTLGSS